MKNCYSYSLTVKPKFAYGVKWSLKPHAKIKIDSTNRGTLMRRRHQTEGQFFAGALALNTAAWILILFAALQFLRHSR